MTERTAAYAAFVSHAPQDKLKADAICRLLEARGLPCCLAPRGARHGVNIAAETLSAMGRSRAMVAVISRASEASRAVLSEMRTAAETGMPMFAVTVEPVVPARAREFAISERRWIDASSGALEDHVERLAEVLAEARITATAWVGPDAAQLSRRLRWATGVPAIIAVLVFAALLLWAFAHLLDTSRALGGALGPAFGGPAAEPGGRTGHQ